ncbi:hypothetical protein LXL04_011076 [Taraxacum kok-saghyz]
MGFFFLVRRLLIAESPWSKSGLLMGSRCADGLRGDPNELGRGLGPSFARRVAETGSGWTGVATGFSFKVALGLEQTSSRGGGFQCDFSLSNRVAVRPLYIVAGAGALSATSSSSSPISPSSMSIFSGFHVSDTHSSLSSSGSSSDSLADPVINGLNGAQSSSTSKRPMVAGTPLIEAVISSFSFLLEEVRRHTLPCDTSLQLQNELKLTSNLPNLPAIAPKFASSQV